MTALEEREPAELDAGSLMPSTAGRRSPARYFA
jgi:hypothetical protein